jgi:hypothetical protein
MKLDWTLEVDLNYILSYFVVLFMWYCTWGLSMKHKLTNIFLFPYKEPTNYLNLCSKIQNQPTLGEGVTIGI